MNKKGDNGNRKTAEEYSRLIDRDPPEEEIHQFLKDRVFGMGHGNPRFSEHFIEGTISKFPITPDRIPDFTCVMLNVMESQTPSRMTFIELKRPSSPLYTSHSRMSKELNDAWMECVETSRLIADNFRDCLRRVVKTLDEKRSGEFEAFYSAQGQNDNSEDQGRRQHFFGEHLPWCNSVILIGRRSSLDSEGLLRTRELSASTGRGIRVITYDTVLDWLADARQDAPFFQRGWFW